MILKELLTLFISIKYLDDLVAYHEEIIFDLEKGHLLKCP